MALRCYVSRFLMIYLTLTSDYGNWSRIFSHEMCTTTQIRFTRNVLVHFSGWSRKSCCIKSVLLIDCFQQKDLQKFCLPECSQFDFCTFKNLLCILLFILILDVAMDLWFIFCLFCFSSNQICNYFDWLLSSSQKAMDV